MPSISCDHCSIECKDEESLKKHFQSKHQSYKCELCSQLISGLAYLTVHYRATHNTIPPECSDKPQFFCDKCPDIFFSKWGLKKHMEVHADSKTKELLRLKKERKEVIKICPHCQKKFASHRNYLEHIKVVHEKLALFNCDECTRKFASKSKLTEHTRNVHTPVNCQVCGQQVCNAFMLKRHKAKAHNIVPDNVFHCEHCSLFFTTLKRLKYHLETKHLEPNLQS